MLCPNSYYCHSTEDFPHFEQKAKYSQRELMNMRNKRVINAVSAIYDHLLHYENLLCDGGTTETSVSVTLQCANNAINVCRDKYKESLNQMLSVKRLLLKDKYERKGDK